MPRPEDSTAYRIETLPANVDISESEMVISDYGIWLWNRRSVRYQGETYRVDCEADVVPSVAAFADGRCRLVDKVGNSPDLGPELQLLLVDSLDPKRRDLITHADKVWGCLFDMESFEMKDALGDFATGTFKSTDEIRTAAKSILLEDKIVGYDSKETQLICLDHDLNTQWRFKPERSFETRYVTPLLVFRDLVIQNFGPDKAWKTPGALLKGQKTQDVLHYGEGLLFAVELQSGKARWQCVIPNAIDSMMINGSQLLVCSVNELHILDAATGETQQVVSTGLSDDYDRYLNESFVHVKDGCVFFAHPADACILVYSLAELELIRRIDIPAPYTVKELLKQADIERKVIYELTSRSALERCHMSPLLEIDLDDLNSEIETLNGPPVNVELRPAADNPEHVEIWVFMRDFPLDEAMLFAEMHLQNQAYYHGRQGAHLASVHITDNFNGKVHFEYSGSDRPAAEVEAKLSMLRARFAKWASEEAFASIDPVPKDDCSLEAVYLADR